MDIRSVKCGVEHTLERILSLHTCGNPSIFACYLQYVTSARHLVVVDWWEYHGLSEQLFGAVERGSGATCAIVALVATERRVMRIAKQHSI